MTKLDRYITVGMLLFLGFCLTLGALEILDEPAAKMNSADHAMCNEKVGASEAASS